MHASPTARWPMLTTNAIDPSKIINIKFTFTTYWAMRRVSMSKLTIPIINICKLICSNRHTSSI